MKMKMAKWRNGHGMGMGMGDCDGDEELPFGRKEEHGLSAGHMAICPSFSIYHPPSVSYLAFRSY